MFKLAIIIAPPVPSIQFFCWQGSFHSSNKAVIPSLSDCQSVKELFIPSHSYSINQNTQQDHSQIKLKSILEPFGVQTLFLLLFYKENT